MPETNPETIDLLVGTTHPHLIESLIELLDTDPDVREKLCKAYEAEWPERAEKFFGGIDGESVGMGDEWGRW